MDAASLWVFSARLSVHLSLTEMELPILQTLLVCACVPVVGPLLKMLNDLSKRVREQLTRVVVCL